MCLYESIKADENDILKHVSNPGVRGVQPLFVAQGHIRYVSWFAGRAEITLTDIHNRINYCEILLQHTHNLQI